MIRELYKIVDNLGVWVSDRTGVPTSSLGWVEQVEEGQTIVAYKGDFGSRELEYIGLDDKLNTRVYFRENQDGLQGGTLDLGCGNVELRASLRSVIQSKKHSPQQLAQVLSTYILAAPSRRLLSNTQAVAVRLEYVETIHSYRRIYQEETGKDTVKGQTNLRWAAFDFNLIYEMPTNCLTIENLCE